MLKCHNYLICKNESENKFCFDCEMLFGKWRNKNNKLIFKNSHCSICNKKDTSVSRPTCDHLLCVNCFKTLYYDCSYEIESENLDLTEYLYYKNELKNCQLCKN